MSAKRKLVVAGLFGVALGIAIWVLMPAQPAELKVTISLDSSIFRAGQPITLHATILNEGKEPVKILEPSLADMTFEVALFDTRNVRHDYLGYQGVRKFDKHAGRHLNPGGSVSLTVPLDRFFDLSPGKYRVVAAYRTLNYPDVDVPFCRVPSNELLFELLPTDRTSQPQSVQNTP